VVEIDGKRIEVSLPKQLFLNGGSKPAAHAPKRKAHTNVQIDSGKHLAAQMQATVVKIAVAEGEKVTAGQQLLVLEAMKMESPQNAVKDTVVKKIHVVVGATVPAGTMLIEFEE
jgi:acetyl-CoA/propionyl-CoA carboxylase biotin carboxyl carrier protein